MTYSKAKMIVRSLGLSVSDGLGFTVCGGRLVNGHECPAWLLPYNGACVWEIVQEFAKRRMKLRK